VKRSFSVGSPSSLHWLWAGLLSIALMAETFGAEGEAAQTASGRGEQTGAVAPEMSSAPPRTRLSMLSFLNVSNRDTTRLPAERSHLEPDLQRLYLQLDHRLDERWTARVLTDVNWLRHESPTDLWVKNAYLQYSARPELVLRLGSAALPWAGFANQWSGYRFVDRELLTGSQVAGSADWGAHASGRHGQLEWAVSAVTGAGFKRPRTTSRADFEGRLAWLPTEHTVLAVGGYEGNRSRDRGDPMARRWNVLVAHRHRLGRIGAQKVYARNWQLHASGRPVIASGWSVWGALNTSENTSVFLRRDRMERRLGGTGQGRELLSQLGLEWTVSSQLRLALAVKRRSSDVGPRSHGANEVGLWSEWRLP